MSAEISNYEKWKRKQALQYFKEKEIGFKYENETQESDLAYVIYEIVINTTVGIFTYIGQTKDLKRRVKQHMNVFCVEEVRVIEVADSRIEAIELEKEMIMTCSSETLLNKHHNIFYAEGTRELVLKSLNKHFINNSD